MKTETNTIKRNTLRRIAALAMLLIARQPLLQGSPTGPDDSYIPNMREDMNQMA